MSGAVANRYARAIFELGAESGTTETLFEEVERAAQAYASSNELQDTLDNPLMTLATKQGILDDIANALSLSDTARKTLHLLLLRRRMAHLPAISRALRQMGNAAKGVAYAEVVSASPLSDEFYGRLQAQLEKMTGKKFVLERREDPSLIAGVIARVGDTVYDGSLRSRLETLKAKLMPN